MMVPPGRARRDQALRMPSAVSDCSPASVPNPERLKGFGMANSRSFTMQRCCGSSFSPASDWSASDRTESSASASRFGRRTASDASRSASGIRSPIVSSERVRWWTPAAECRCAPSASSASL